MRQCRIPVVASYRTRTSMLWYLNRSALATTQYLSLSISTAARKWGFPFLPLGRFTLEKWLQLLKSNRKHKIRKFNILGTAPTHLSSSISFLGTDQSPSPSLFSSLGFHLLGKAPPPTDVCLSPLLTQVGSLGPGRETHPFLLFRELGRELGNVW